MSKVRKLRKKYRSMCVKNKTSADTLLLKSENCGYDTSEFSNNFGTESASLPTKDQDTRSTLSISKSIKSTFSGMSIQKKEKQRLRHELFLKKLDASKEAFTKLKKTRHEKKLNLKDDLPLIRIQTPKKTEKNSKDSIPKRLKTEMKKRNPRKGLTKLRNAQLIEGVNKFREMLINSKPRNSEAPLNTT